MPKKPIVDRYLAPILGLALLAPAATASAQDANATRITEDEFLAGIDETHPAMIAASGPLLEARAERRRAGTLSNPTLEFEYEAPGDEAEQSTLKLGWTPPLDGRRGLAIDTSEASVDAARSSVEWTRLHLRQELRAAFADWAVAQQRVELVAAHQTNLQELKARLEARAARGEESLLAARRFALAVSELEAELARDRAELAAARGRAFALRGDLPLDAAASLPAPPPVPVRLEPTERPDLVAQRKQVDAAVLRQRLSGRVFEFPTLVFGWTRISATDENFDGPYFGLAWDPPIFDRNQDGRDGAAGAVAVAEARLRLAEREATARREAALAAYETLHTSLTGVTRVVDGAPAVADVATRSFLAGESSMTDLLETIRSVLQSQLAALDLHARVLAAHRELELSAGRMLTQGGTN